MSTTTILVEKLTEKHGTTKNGKPWTRWSLKDANGEWYSTFTHDVIAPAAEGEHAEIDWQQDGDFKTLTAVRPVEAPAGEPKFGDGSYVKGRENPDTQRSISAAVALQQAVATLSHTIGQNTPRQEAADRVLMLASEYFRWLLQRTGLERDEDIPI